MEFINIIKQIIFEPRSFFSARIKYGVKYSFAVLALYVFFMSAIQIFLKSYGTEVLPYKWIAFKAVTTVLTFFIAVLTMALVMIILVGIDHLFLMMLKGKGSFEDTFVASILPYTLYFIVYILGAVPAYFLKRQFISERGIVQWSAFAANPVPGVIYVFYILIILALIVYCIYWSLGYLSVTHKISKLRAFVATIVLPLIVIVLLILVVVIIMVVAGAVFINSLIS